MNEFFTTILFIVVFLGGIILLACAPFLIRAAVRRNARKRRLRKLEEMRQVQLADGQVFEVTVRLSKEELKEVIRLEDRGKHPIVLSLLASLVLLSWVIGGSNGIREMIIGVEPATAWRWIRSLLGVIVGLLLLYVIWMSAFVQRKRIDGVSEFEVSQATRRTYLIDAEGLRLVIDGEEVEVMGWDGVDHMVEESAVLRIVLVSGDFLWIPNDALFHQGDWESLRSMLQPLKKGEHEV